MSMEFCEGCDRDIDTDYDINGVYITTKAVLYGDNPEPESVTFSCGDCQDKLQDEYESLEAAREDHGRSRATEQIIQGMENQIKTTEYKNLKESI